MKIHLEVLTMEEQNFNYFPVVTEMFNITSSLTATSLGEV